MRAASQPTGRRTDVLLLLEATGRGRSRPGARAPPRSYGRGPAAASARAGAGVVGAGKTFLAIWNLIAGAGGPVERVPIPRPQGDAFGKAQAFAYYRLLGDQPRDFFGPGPGANAFDRRQLYVKGPPERAPSAVSADTKTVPPPDPGPLFPSAKVSGSADIQIPNANKYEIRKIFFPPEVTAGRGEAGALIRAIVTDNPVGFEGVDTRAGLTIDLVPEYDADTSARFGLIARTTSPTYGSAMARWYTSVGTNIPDLENLFALIIEATDGPAGPNIDVRFTSDDPSIMIRAPRLRFSQRTPGSGHWVLNPEDRFLTIDFTVPAHTGRTSPTDGVGLLADLETGYEMRASLTTPEPATAGLVLLGGVGVAVLARRKGKRDGD